MIRNQAGSVPFYSFEVLSAREEIVHAVFTRLGGVSRSSCWALNVGHSVGDEPQAVDANQRLICETLTVSDSHVVTARQVHGDRVAVVDSRDWGTVVPETDSLITSDPGVNLMLRFADCLPILLYDRQGGVIGLGHAGWRGTAAKIASRMVSAMIDSFGTDPANVIAALGPAIGPCCYDVGMEVAQAIKGTVPKWQSAVQPLGDSHFSVDLWEANRQQLVDRGVAQVEIGRICTACRVDEFFSHRADHGETGRFAALIGIREST